jgi:uroporphyrinogen decarboxylase
MKNTSNPVSVCKRLRAERSVFVRACLRQKTPYTPVWLMRQAGRYMDFYRRIRRRVAFMRICKDSALAAEVTVKACEKIGADAAILFSDILLILEPMGFRLRYDRGAGPVIREPVRTGEQVRSVLVWKDESSLSFVGETLRIARSALRDEVALIGFSGAPFTLASYLIEGGKTRDRFEKTRNFMRAYPEAWHRLLGKISASLVRYLKMQVKAGADALQIFDSWAGCLKPEEYRQFVLPHSRSLIDGLAAEVPVIHFATGTGPFLRHFAGAGGEVIGLDHTVSLGAAWKKIGYRFGVQGNLDPRVLLRGPAAIRIGARKILAEAGGRPGHIFNLGHGVLPATPEENVRILIDYVREASAKQKRQAAS